MTRNTQLPHSEMVDLLGDLDVLVEEIVWLPGAGLTVGEWPRALVSLGETMESMAEMPLVRQLPVLERFLLDDEIDMDEMCAVLEKVPGFIFRVRTPVRRWFSNGDERLNWAETHEAWAYAKSPDDFADIAVAFANDRIKEDERKYPRIEMKIAA